LCLRPLVAAELVQGRVLGRGTGIAGDQVQRCDGYVQLVAVRVFEGQELAGNAAGFEGDEAEIAPDAVLRMHDRRTGGEIVELANDRFRIPLCAAAPGALARLLPD